MTADHLPTNDAETEQIWKESSIELYPGCVAYFCKITSTSGLVLYGSFETSRVISDTTNHLRIPLMHQSNAVNHWRRKNTAFAQIENSKRTGFVAQFNLQQLDGHIDDIDEIYQKLGTTMDVQGMPIMRSVTFGGLPPHTIRLYVGIRDYKSKENMTQMISKELNWKIEPLTIEEIENLNKI